MFTIIFDDFNATSSTWETGSKITSEESQPESFTSFYGYQQLRVLSGGGMRDPHYPKIYQEPGGSPHLHSRR